MNNICVIEDLINQIKAANGDKPQINHLAKALRAQVDIIVKLTAPGAGDFKWSAKVIKQLVKPAYSKDKKPSILIATSTSGGETWHTNGHYLKLGQTPKRLGDIEEESLDIKAVTQVVAGACGGDIVSIVGTHDTNADLVMLDNGVAVMRTLITYTMDGFTDITLTNKGKEKPICVLSKGVCVGVVMPYRVA